MIKNIAVVLVLVLVAVLSVLHLRKQIAPCPSDGIPNVATDSAVASTAKVADALSPPVVEREALPDVPQPAEKADDVQTALDADVSEVLADSQIKQLPPEVQDALKNLISGSASRMSAQQGAPTVRDMYAELFSKLNLTDEATEKLLVLLERKRNPFFPRSSDAMERDIHDILGDEGYSTYQEYERTMPVRLFVDDLATRLSNEGVPMTDEQVATMLLIDPELVGRLPLSYGSTSLSFKGSEGASVDAMLEGAVDESVSDFDHVVQEAEAVLEPEQMKVFDSYLGETFEAQENMAKFVGQMLPQVMGSEITAKISGSESDDGTTVIRSSSIQVHTIMTPSTSTDE